MTSLAITPPARARRKGLTLATREAIQGYLYILPWALGFLFFTLGPMLASMYLSLTQYTMMAPPRFVGLRNYLHVFNDRLFWKSLQNTAYYALIFVPISITGSLCCAILLNQKIVLRTVFRSLYFLPSITPIVATGLIWVFLFQPTAGLINYLLSMIGIDGPGWLATTTWSKPALIIIALWGAVGGGNMLIFLAGLQGVPIELQEAAEIDGANSWQRFWRVTIPLITPTVFFSLLLGVIGALQQFTLAYVVTSAGAQTRVVGGPAYSTLFYVLNLYNYAFDFWEMGYGSALAWIFFLVVLTLTYIQLRSSSMWVYYESAAGELKW